MVQTTLAAFSSSPKKRTSDGDEVAESAAKKAKTSEGNGDDDGATASSTSSTHVQEMIEVKKMNAALKLHKDKLTYANLDTLSLAPLWKQALKAELSKPYFAQIKTTLTAKEKAGEIIFPPKADIFSWSRLCTPAQVKVVVIGQDPYHQPGQAHGLSFSVRRGIKTPPSLANMYKELHRDLGTDFPIPKHGDLTSWAAQGVLLLNQCLTVTHSKANSHKAIGWTKFSTAVVKHINQTQTGVVFLLWGAHAQKNEATIDKKKHRVLKTSHPSPLSHYRGFTGSGCFSDANKCLKELKRTPIDWTSVCEK